ncbi:MarR family winged helix-turn-helix transcriptional regulator [Kribbella solani]|uniref:DNA-binding MarR family transcriptional regulator n=1 Tax=Kribbella solani TaxID=236067 RepID=A0A841DVB3_9ACTN|nr:MarR family transcriptional regulator [Kribbella solani]MBB5982562.1 DNA-binding MarR family transcriptional regulator [Kribbella solani]MDX2967704.1 MarR family transcriptional regulator [Kribbella solani]MDX3001138.1 MarR family transcriptional regulator [Kribbella solani]
MSTGELERLGEELVVVATRLSRLATRNVNTLPHAAMRVLGRLDELGEARISELAKADRCSQPTMSNLVQRLEEQGWVRRGSDPADSRASLISLTDAGLAELRGARSQAGAALAAHLGQLPAHDLATLEAAATVIHKLLAIEPLEATPR